MKKFMNLKVIGYGLWVMVALLVSAPVTAQNQQEWKSTSSMHTSGSTYSPQVAEIGATTVTPAATTTESYSPAQTPNRAKKFDTGGDSGQSTESPVGDAMIPLLLMAMTYAFFALRRKARRAA